MKPIRKKRLQTVLLILATSALGSFLIIRALDSNLDFFYTPSVVFLEEIPENKRIKIGGMVLESSVIRENTKISFIFPFLMFSTLHVVGTLPDIVYFFWNLSIQLLGRSISYSENRCSRVFSPSPYLRKSKPVRSLSK